jgi:hypothetical protein
MRRAFSNPHPEEDRRSVSKDQASTGTMPGS